MEIKNCVKVYVFRRTFLRGFYARFLAKKKKEKNLLNRKTIMIVTHKYFILVCIYMCVCVKGGKG